MFSSPFGAIAELFSRGGWVMWPLGALSLIGVMLIFERSWFWIRTNHPARLILYRRVSAHLRRGERAQAEALVGADDTPYGRLTLRLLEEEPTESAVMDAIESQRHRLDRFMPTLGTIITAAPMLGILGTVTGIIAVSKVFSDAEPITEPARILPGIGEALLTTVVGLVVALVVLFPHNAFRAQIERTLSRMEALAAAVQAASGRQNAGPADP